MVKQVPRRRDPPGHEPLDRPVTPSGQAGCLRERGQIHGAAVAAPRSLTRLQRLREAVGEILDDCTDDVFDYGVG